MGSTAWQDIVVGSFDGIPAVAGEDPTPYWRSCKAYSCGVWRLLHLLTVVAAEDAGEDMPRGFLREHAGSEALARIRGFVDNFFADVVADRFIQAYDACSHGRCALEPRDGRGVALWFWRVHNDIAEQLFKDSSSTARFEKWPTASSCPTCWKGEKVEDAVYTHLKASYLAYSWEPYNGELVDEAVPFFGSDEADIIIVGSGCVTAVVATLVLMLRRRTRRTEMVNKIVRQRMMYRAMFGNEAVEKAFPVKDDWNPSWKSSKGD